MKRNVAVDFTKGGWRQYFQLNRTLGARLLQGFILRAELAEYIAQHEASGARLDEVCLELHYADGVYLLLRQVQGVWLITDIWRDQEPAGFSPVFFWTRLKRGCCYVLRQILIGWQQTLCRSGSEVFA